MLKWDFFFNFFIKNIIKLSNAFVVTTPVLQMNVIHLFFFFLRVWLNWTDSKFHVISQWHTFHFLYYNSQLTWLFLEWCFRKNITFYFAFVIVPFERRIYNKKYVDWYVYGTINLNMVIEKLSKTERKRRT